MDQLKNDNNSILYDEKTNCVYSNHIKIERDVEFYKSKMPKRHNINFEWSRITNLNCVEKIEKNVDYGDCTICIEPNDDFLKSRCTTCFSCFHKKCFPVDQENCPNCRVGKVGNYKGKSFISWEKAEKTESLPLRIFENIKKKIYLEFDLQNYKVKTFSNRLMEIVMFMTDEIIDQVLAGADEEECIKKYLKLFGVFEFINLHNK